MNFKKLTAVLLMCLMVLSLFAGCKTETPASTAPVVTAGNEDKAIEIMKAVNVKRLTLKDFYFRHGLKVQEDEALQSNPRFWELIENARTASKS